MSTHAGLHASGCDAIPPLLGHTVAVTGDRRFEELAAHLRAAGATVLHGPVLRTRAVTEDGGSLRAATTLVLDRPPDHLLATTGIGMRSWLNAAASWGLRPQLLGALGGAHVLARGPKVAGALFEGGLPVHAVEPSGRTMAMVERLCRQRLTGAHVALQLPGAAMPEAVFALREAGADVTTLAAYDWAWPPDLRPSRRLLRAVVDGHVSAVTFTSRPAVRNFLALAARDGMATEVHRVLAEPGATLAVCIGTATADELRGITGVVPHLPAEPVLGMLVQAVADGVRHRGHHHVHIERGDEVVVQQRLVAGGGGQVTLSEREAAVLRVLLSTGRRTVSRTELLRSIWRGDTVDPSVLETTMARLRRRLSKTGMGILTVNGRGYLVEGEIVPCPRTRSLTPAG